jgi:hypothetical protein
MAFLLGLDVISRRAVEGLAQAWCQRAFEGADRLSSQRAVLLSWGASSAESAGSCAALLAVFGLKLRILHAGVDERVAGVCRQTRAQSSQASIGHRSGVSRNGLVFVDPQ